MVAYSFNSAFVHQVEALIKRQTIRAHRKRHARPGEAVQLFTGMRTRNCRKLVTPDPICTQVSEVWMKFDDGSMSEMLVDGIPLRGAELERFACDDGFDPKLNPLARRLPGITASRLMARFWSMTHSGPVFDGVLVIWKPETAD